MAKANKTGILLEDFVFRVLSSIDGAVVYKQYPLRDIFGVGKIDFKLEYKNKNYFIETKNQNVSGSVDQKLPFYIENIRESKYPGHFMFIIKGDGIRSGAISYLKNKQKELDFSIIEFERLHVQLNELLNFDIIQTVNYRVKPVIKWAGGKRLIMDKIKNMFPEKIDGNYYEPFCGGISVACELYNKGRFSDNTVIYLNDNIPQLMTLYDTIKRDLNSLYTELKNPRYIVNSENFKNNKEKYNNCNNTAVETAALFLFLNKAGYNGVYRENGDGKYNIPFCKKENIVIYEEENLYSMHIFLQRCMLSCDDYKSHLISAKSGDVVYCDPPYHATFNSYTKNKFKEEDQIELAKLCHESQSNVFVSNSNTDLIKRLYNCCEINEIPVKRVVNSKPEMRSNINYELFINI